jgi:3',5'-cyclic-AMP phosphodiesterase
MTDLSRRGVLVSGCAIAAGAVVRGKPLESAAEPAHRARKRVLRVAHLTDAHVRPEKRAEEGMAMCLRHAQGLADKPDLILQGGDAVMEVLNCDAARAKAQAEVWRRVLKNECSLPIEHCIGNHDVWGVDKVKSKTTGNEPLWGKKWAMDLYGITTRYRAFDRAGWRFIVLDSTFITERGYTAKLDPEQFAWLERTLRETDAKTPVLVLSHIPILTVTAYLDGENEKTGDWVVPGAWMHIDARAIKNLFLKHPNVKVCLSGHIHLADRVDYLGVSYICNGAVCGGWWGGPYQECKEGYGLVDLFDDGTFENQYVEYGWKARE